jgi:hypothetical protein
LLQIFELSPITPATATGNRGGHWICRGGNRGRGTPVIDLDKPLNDVTDQLRPAWPELDEIELDTAALGEVIEADPADVADQRRVVPLPDDEPDPTGVRP